ncbi:MAG: hypothetical protein GQ535_12900 [Rhodobacteraceae bacterium]|nr:hypothetical protein [Paracoccaceae bacterium]
MTMLLGANDKVFWSGPPATTTDVAFFDVARVDYAFNMVDAQNVTLNGNHPAPSGTTVWYSCRIYSATGTGAAEDGELALIKDAAGNSLVLVDMANGKPWVRVYGDSDVTGAATTILSAGHNDFKVKVDVSGGTISAEIWLNGVLISSASAAETSGKGVARHWTWQINDAIWGAQYFSEFGVYDAEPGTGRFTKVSPASDGTDTDLTGAVGNLSDDDISTVVSADAAAQKSCWNMATYSGGSGIAELVVSAWITAGAGAPGNFRFYLLIGGARYYGATQAISAGAGMLASESWALDPSDSLAWTATKVNAAQPGWEAMA